MNNRELLKIPVGLVLDSIEGLNIWLPSILKTNGLHPQVIWCTSKALAKSVDSRTSGGLQIIYDEVPIPFTHESICSSSPTDSSNKMRSLFNLLHRSDIHGIVICCHEALELFILEHLLKKTNKHVFNTAAPSYDHQTIVHLAQLYECSSMEVAEASPNRPRIWDILRNHINETAWKHAKAVTEEIGNIIGCEIRSCNEINERYPDGSYSFLGKKKTRGALLEMCAEFIILLEMLIGSIESVNVAPTEDVEEDKDNNGRSNETPQISSNLKKGMLQQSVAFLNGQITFTTGCELIFSFINVEKPVDMQFTLWGTAGVLQVQRTGGKPVYEVRRDLRHFEHPRSYQMDGIVNSLQSWNDSIQSGTPAARQGLLWLHRAAVIAQEMVTVNGGLIQVEKGKNLRKDSQETLGEELETSLKGYSNAIEFCEAHLLETPKKQITKDSTSERITGEPIVEA